MQAMVTPRFGGRGALDRAGGTRTAPQGGTRPLVHRVLLEEIGGAHERPDTGHGTASIAPRVAE